MAREVDLGSVIGPAGEQGPTGPAGESAYQTWLKQSGNSGKTEEEFLQSLKGETGAAGAPGTDGQAATIQVGSVTSGASPAVNNSGTANAAIFDFVLQKGDKGDKGEKGDKGDPWEIAKTYTSISAMNSGYATDNVPIGGIVAINTGNVEDADNAKIYRKGEFEYEYLFDMSGATGIKGDKGDKGEDGADGAAATIRVGTVTSGMTASVTNAGTQNAAVFNFVLPKGDKGDKGDTGATGAAGTDGAKGDKGDPGETPTFEIRNGHLFAIFED